jgi:predicted enzyme related to lactoylglutathione lyase
MSITIKEIAFVFHPTADVARARRFYERLLGLKIGHQIEFAPGLWWIEYDVAGVALAVSNAAGDPHAAIQPVSCVTLEVADLDDTLAQLRAAGITISQEVMEFPPCRMFAAKDPDGNEIRFHQRKAS